MKYVFLLGLTYVAFVLETAIGHWSLPGATVPQFMFLTAALAVLWCPGSTAIFWAVVAGLFADVAGGGPMGLNVVLLANLAFVAQMACGRQSSDSIFTSAAFILLFVTFAGFASQALHHVLTGGSPGMRLIGVSSVSRAGGTTAVYLIIAMTWVTLAHMARLLLPARTVTPGRPRWAQ